MEQNKKPMDIARKPSSITCSYERSYCSGDSPQKMSRLCQCVVTRVSEYLDAVCLLFRRSDRLFPKVWEPFCWIMLSRMGHPDRLSHFRLPGTQWPSPGRFDCWEEINSCFCLRSWISERSLRGICVITFPFRDHHERTVPLCKPAICG